MSPNVTERRNMILRVIRYHVIYYVTQQTTFDGFHLVTPWRSLWKNTCFSLNITSRMNLLGNVKLHLKVALVVVRNLCNQ